MHRAQKTFELLNFGLPMRYPWSDPSAAPSNTLCDASRHTNASITVTDKIREWDYGEYEGITSAEIRARRKEQGIPGTWDIWRDGCPGGESPEDVIKRVDELIQEIREQHHKPALEKGSDNEKLDVLVVGHGHILRAFAMRWIGQPLAETKLIMEAGGVGTLSYEHRRLEEPAILLGGGFVVGSHVLAEVDREEKEGLLK